jgi:hypothetical protein
MDPPMANQYVEIATPLQSIVAYYDELRHIGSDASGLVSSNSEARSLILKCGHQNNCEGVVDPATNFKLAFYRWPFTDQSTGIKHSTPLRNTLMATKKAADATLYHLSPKGFWKKFRGSLMML